MDNLEDFLASGEPEEVQVQEPQEPETAKEQAPPEETPEQKTERERDERGRFKAKEEADEPVMVPLKALHETRDELKALKAEIEQYRQKPEPQQTQAVPDIFEDPDGFVAHQKQELQQAILNERLNLSEEMVKASVGAETVEEAKQWAAQQASANPMFVQQLFSARNPYGFLVEQYKKATTFAKLGDDPDEIEAYLAWKQAKEAPAPVVETPPVPETLADAQSARGSSAEPFKVPTLDQILGRPT
jgi:hypothetical protein